MKLRFKLLSVLLLSASSLFPVQSTRAVLAPQGDWPLCYAGIQMPDCVLNPKPIYMLDILGLSGPASWVMTVTMADGSISILSGTASAGASQIFDLDFGGVVAHWSVQLQDVRTGSASRRR